MSNESMWSALWVGVSVKSSLVLGIAWLITFTLRRRSAAMRHLVWTAGAAAVLAVPFFSLWLPALPIPSAATIAPGVAALFETTARVSSDSATGRLAGRSGVASPKRPIQKPLDWRLLLMSLWAAGAAAAFTQMSIAFAAMSRMRRAAGPSVDGELAAELARNLELSHAVQVLETPAGCMPMTWGILRPVIFMPSDARGWTDERRRMVLLHELAHVRRGDVATHLCARLALILNWWNPLAWMAWREFLKERERATDDLVLRSGARASEYAGHLLEVARAMRSEPALAWGAVAMARRSQLEGRVVAILDSRQDRKTPARAAVFGAALLAIVMAAPFAALRAQDQASAPVPVPVPGDIDATIRAAQAQKNSEMLVKAAEAFEALRQYDNAKKLLDAAIPIGEQGALMVKLAELEEKRGQRKQAEELYARAAQLLGDRPEAAPAMIHLGVLNLSNKNYQQAAEYFQKAQNLDAGEAGRALMWMALLREREQNPVEAESFYQRAIAVEAPSSDGAATTMELYAQFLKQQGRAEEARSMSNRASDIRKALGEQERQVKSNALRIGSGVTAPKVLNKMEPEYTEEGRVAKYQGTVVLTVEIDPSGLAQNIRIIKGLGFGLDENAVTAVQQWQFQPATKDGAAVTVQATIEVNFRLL
ncbi:MAG: TonB family protein [Bryobacteraceae bacterium]|jgi:TonB family protein